MRPTSRPELLDLAFLVGYVLADDGIELFHLQLFGCRALILGRGVEMTGSSGRNKLDLISHGRNLYTLVP